MKNHKAGSGKVDWYTPAPIIEAARIAMGGEITLDPSSCAKANKTVKARRFITLKEDGLAFWTQWVGAEPERIWLNPPYARGVVADFVRRLIDEVRKDAGPTGHQACCLVNADTSTSWFQLLLKCSDAVCFFDQRLAFIDGDTMQPTRGNNQGQAAFYFGPHIQRFAIAFAKMGQVVVTWSTDVAVAVSQPFQAVSQPFQVVACDGSREQTIDIIDNEGAVS
jgi:phage N-6-adenine-methyltransferase